MFYLLKHLLLLNLIILKLKCINLIFNEILILYASYMCLLYSRFVENHPIWILGDGPLISEVVLLQLVSEPGSGLNAHSKHLKIITMFMVRTLSPYKNYSSLLRWQASICIHIATTELH
jgi:hypothetical protein